MYNNNITTIRYFNSDTEFEDFCVAPYAIIKETESGVLYYTGEYSEEYLECIENDTKFVNIYNI